MKKVILFVVATVILLIIAGGYFIYQNQKSELLKINPGPGFDNEGNGPICTQEAKSCGDGTYVERTGLNCEFAKCPGKKPDSDFVSTELNPIQLPDNVITEKDCVKAGGEVFNTLGETSYDGELIGKIEGLRCPCACLVRDKKENKPCMREYRPVCGQPSMPECPEGLSCAQVMPSLKTYSNKCMMENDGAELLYVGKCK